MYSSRHLWAWNLLVYFFCACHTESSIAFAEMGAVWQRSCIFIMFHIGTVHSLICTLPIVFGGPVKEKQKWALGLQNGALTTLCLLWFYCVTFCLGISIFPYAQVGASLLKASLHTLSLRGACICWLLLSCWIIIDSGANLLMGAEELIAKTTTLTKLDLKSTTITPTQLMQPQPPQTKANPQPCPLRPQIY